MSSTEGNEGEMVKSGITVLSFLLQLFWLPAVVALILTKTEDPWTFMLLISLVAMGIISWAGTAAIIEAKWKMNIKRREKAEEVES